MVKGRERLKYFAILMHSWMTNIPLNYIIKRIISYYDDVGRIWVRSTRKFQKFEPNNKELINYIINELIADIDNCLRFRIKNYVSNYFWLIESIKPELVMNSNWADYLEYGTTNSEIIALQNIGFPRHLSIFIKEKFNDLIVYSEGHVKSINTEKILERINKEENSNEYKEILEILN